MPPTQRIWLLSLLLAVLTVFVYLPAMSGGFIWDDDDHLTHNAVVIGPLGLKEIWTTSAARICPMTLSCFWLQHALWGLHPLPYHLVNIVMHSISAILLWRVLLRLQVPGAWFGALLWSVHPVQVESVAWITELKNTQSCLFYLLTILFFLKWMDTAPAISPRQRELNYLLAIVFTAMAMASKSSTVVLPVVLGLCAWWIQGEWSLRNSFRLMPFFVLAALASGVSIWTANVERAGEEYWFRTGPEKLVTAGNIVWFYIGKLLWPHPLMFIYPRWEVDLSRISTYLGTVAVCAALLLLWWNRQGRLRPLFFAFSYFLVALLPVMGLVEHYFLRYSFVGDHFQYLASIGIVSFVTACGATACQAAGSPGNWIGWILGGLVAFAFGAQTWHYERVFASDERLWGDTLSKNPKSWIAQNNLGNVLASSGNFVDAIGHFSESLRLNPRNAQAHNNWGVALVAMGQPLEAISHYNEAMRLNPKYSDAQTNLGIAQAAVSNIADSHFNQGIAFASQGNHAEAIIHYAETLRLMPDDAEAHHKMGMALTNLGDAVRAIVHYTEALRLKPDYPEAHNNLGVALAQLNRRVEAEAQFREALRLKPDHPDAKSNLDRILQ